MAVCRSVAILLYCGALTGFGQGIATGTASIIGRVYNSLTGATIAGASVRAWSLTGSRQGDTPTSTSQSDGTFRFDTLQPGQYILLVEKEGFVFSGPRRGVRLVQLQSGDVASGIEISMLPDGGLGGNVVGENGQPMAGVQVQALSVVGGATPARLKAVGPVTTTEKRGHYSLPKLPPGNYYLVAVPDSSALNPRKDGYQYVSTFFPDAASASQGSPVLVRAGELSPADVKLRLALVHRIDGKIAELPAGVSLKSVRLILAPAGESRVPQLHRSGNVNPDGTFSIMNVPSGSYELMLRTGRRRGSLLSRQDVEVGADDVSGIVLRPMEPIMLKGTVTQDGSGALPIGNVSVQAIPTEEGRRSFANVTADGTFALSGLEPASYFLTVRCSRPGMYVSALSLNGRDILNEAVDLSEISTGQINVVVRSGAGDIGGTVSDNPSMVILQPESLAPDGSNVQIRYTQPGGVFDFANVPPGDYVLYATELANPSVWMQPGFLHAIENFGTAVHLDENGKQQVQLTLAPKALLENEALRLGLNFD